jgi:N utilization substance protein A
MRNDLSRAIRQLASERGLTEHVIMEALEAAMIAAYRKAPDAWAQNVRIGVDPVSGESRVFAQLAVVEEVQDKRTQVSVSEAHRINPEAEPGDVFEIDVTPKDFGRIAAQTAKQVILQRIREAEREATFHTYADREGEIVQATVQNFGPEGITVGLDKAEALLPRTNQMSSEQYSRNQRIRVYVQEVRKTVRGPEIIVSRTHKNLLRRLMELEVPEIFNGTVEIKAIAREAGSRSKVAVAARQEGVDPVGACVGIRGVRIQALVNELNGEKIDIVAWDPDPSTFIANALSPAQATNVRLVDALEGRTAEVIVPDRQLSLAIGKEGQNARLAAKLTGWRIDIKSETEATQEALRRIQEEAKRVEERKAIEAARALLAEAEAKEIEEATIAARDGKVEPLEEPTVQEAAAEAEVEVTPEVETIAAEVEPEVAAEAEREVMVEAETPVEEEPVAAASPEIVKEAQEPEVKQEIEVAEEIPVVEEEPLSIDWDVFVEEEEEELGKPHDPSRKKKAKKKQRQRRLEYDRELGEVVARKYRRPSREQDWWDSEADTWRFQDYDDRDEDLDDLDEDPSLDQDYEAYLDYDEDEDSL